jgi:hypothetical protein
MAACDATELVKRAVCHFVCSYMHVLLPQHDVRDVPFCHNVAGDDAHMITVDTVAFRLLHQVGSNTSAKLKFTPLSVLCRAEDKDLASTARYAQRTMRPRRDLLFHFRFSQQELDHLVQGAQAVALGGVMTTSHLDFFWSMCPLDVMIGERTRGASDGIAYALETSVGANRAIAKSLAAYRADVASMQKGVAVLMRCGTQMSEYSRMLRPLTTPPSVCDWVVSRESRMHENLTQVFCDTTKIYSPGHTFYARLQELTRASDGRNRTLILRASLDQLKDGTDASTYVDACAAHLRFIRGQAYEQTDADYRRTFTAAQHTQRIGQIVRNFEMAWKHDGVVCAMMQFVVDAAHDTLTIHDTYLHPAFHRRTHVLDGFARIVRALLSDEAVHTCVVLAPVTMNRALALPAYKALFEQATEPLLLPASSRAHEYGRIACEPARVP